MFHQGRESGQSLVIVMMSAAIGMIVSLGMMAALNNLQMGANSIKFRTDSDTVNEEMRALLSSPMACMNSFGGRVVTVATDDSIAELRDGTAAPGAVRYTVNASYSPCNNPADPAQTCLGDRTVRLTAMKLAGFQPDIGQTGIMTLFSSFDVVKTASGAQVVMRKILLHVELDATNKIVGCVAYSKMTDGIWRRSSSDANNIYYEAPGGTSGFVGVGTSDPTSLFTVSANAGNGSPNFGGGSKMLELRGNSGNFSEPKMVFTEAGNVIASVSAKNMANANGALIFSTNNTPNSATGDTERMRISQTGRVGVGVTNPQSALDVSGDFRYSGGIYNSRGDLLIAGNDADWLRIGQGSGGFTTNSVAGYGNWSFGSGGVTVGTWSNAIPAGNLYVTNNVGIGTSAPDHPLTVRGGDPVASFVSMGGNAYLRLSVNGDLGQRLELANRGGRTALWNPNTGDVFNIVHANGNVGIANADPQSRLDVAGEVRVGSTGQGCFGGNEGSMRYNYSSHKMEVCNGSAWVGMGGLTACRVGWLYEATPYVGWSDYSSDDVQQSVPGFLTTTPGYAHGVYIQCK